MGNLTVLAKNKILNFLLNGDAYTPFIGESEIRLVTSNGTDTVAGVEVDSDSYEPVDAYWEIIDGLATNKYEIIFDLLSDDTSVEVAGIEVWSGLDAPERIAFAPLTSPVLIGPTESFTISAFNIELVIL